MKKTIVSLCVALALLAGCGVKPPRVDPPQGADKDYFPRTYPDPATDPRPDPEKLIK
jgi:predicted small lipoprotein YifL